MKVCKVIIPFSFALTAQLICTVPTYSASSHDQYHADRIVISQIFQRVFFQEWIGEPITYPAVGKCAQPVIDGLRSSNLNIVAQLMNGNGSEGFCRLVNFRHKNRSTKFIVSVPNFVKCETLIEKISQFQHGQANESINLKKETVEWLLNEMNKLSGRTYYQFEFSGYELDKGKFVSIGSGVSSFKKFRPFKVTNQLEKNGTCYLSVQMNE